MFVSMRMFVDGSRQGHIGGPDRSTETEMTPFRPHREEILHVGYEVVSLLGKF